MKTVALAGEIRLGCKVMCGPILALFLFCHQSLGSDTQPGKPSGPLWSPLTGIGAVAVQSDGRILAAGGGPTFVFSPTTGVFGWTGCNILRLKPDGVFDSDFRGNLPAEYGNAFAYFLRVQADDRIVVVGNFNVVQDVPVSGQTRLLPNGKLDRSYLPEKDTNSRPVKLKLVTIRSFILQSTGCGMRFTVPVDWEGAYALQPGQILTASNYMIPLAEAEQVIRLWSNEQPEQPLEYSRRQVLRLSNGDRIVAAGDASSYYLLRLKAETGTWTQVSG